VVLACVLAVSAGGQSQWAVKPNSVTASLNAIVYGNGLFVAVGDNGTIVTSPDGETWTLRTSGTTDRLPAIAFGNGHFVATRVNRSNPALTSGDGITWKPASVTNADGTVAATGAYETIVFGEGRFLAGGSSSSGKFELISSEDGMSFRTVTALRGASLAAIQWLGFFRGQFYAFLNPLGLYTSADTISWTHSDWLVSSNGAYPPVLATDAVSKIASLGLGSGTFFFSIDAGHTFQSSEQPVDRYQPAPTPPAGISSPTFRAACYGAGSFVAVDSQGGAWTSERGEFWLPRGHYAKAGEGFRGVAFDGVGRFVAVGSVPTSGYALIAVAQADPPPPSPPGYTVYDLKDLSNGVFDGEPRAISNSGIIAGSVSQPNGKAAAAILRDGNVAIYPATFYHAYPTRVTAVNDDGIAASEVVTGSLGISSYTFGVALPAQAETFPPPATYNSTAPSINSTGWIVGTYYSDRSNPGIYRYNALSGERADLGNLGLNQPNAFAINDAGDIAGAYVDQTIGLSRPFRLSADGQLLLIPNLGGTCEYELAMNAAGDIAGSSAMPSAPFDVFGRHAFLFKNGRLDDIDSFNSRSSFANGMNNDGDVVGDFWPANLEVWQHLIGNAFLYHNGTMYNLNRLLDASGDGWVLYRAMSINDKGWIVGQGWRHAMVDHLEPFLAVPNGGAPAGMQTRFVNVSTRLRTATGDDVLIGGFIIRGGAKRLVIRALGPTSGLPNRLADPTLELFNDRGERIAFNDNFTDLPYRDQGEIGNYNLRIWNSVDSAIAVTLSEGNYTAVVRGKNGGTGNCLVEVYNVDTDYTPGLANISTRGPVGVGDDVMIAGFIIRGDRERHILIRGIGPSLAKSGVANPLLDPTLEIHDQNGQIAANDDWRTNQETEITASGFAPGDDREAAVVLSLWPGAYTAIVRGKAGGTGNALVEVYALP